MKNFYSICLLIILLLNTSAALEFKYDNNIPAGNIYTSSRVGWEESVLFVPAGPCTINKLKIYFYGNTPGKDTIYICGYPTAGNLYPTEYIWSYNTLVDPLIVDYDGIEGWKEFDITSLGLKSDGVDKIVIQHKMKANGPYFGYDSDGRQGQLSWFSDPFTPNANFYNIEGTIHYQAPGDYLVRLELSYLYPEGNTSRPAPLPSLVQISFGVSGENTVVDIDKDGWDDIVLGGNIFKNNYSSNGEFENYSAQTKIYGAGTNWADYDNDGDMDCYAFVNGSFDWDKRMVLNNDKLYRNNGDWKFSAVDNLQVFKFPYPNPAVDFNLGTGDKNETYFNPYNTCTPFWLDYNSDGKTDLFIANKRIEISGKPEIFCPDQIWINNGDGTFSNRRTAANLASGEPFNQSFGGYYDCYGASAADYNNDMKPDIYVATYRLAPDNLFKNLGAGSFQDVGSETGVIGNPTYADGYFGHGMGSSWGDFNNDGLIDLCVGNLAHTDSRGLFSNPSLIFRNKKVGNDFKFDEVHKEMGLKFHEGNAGACWADFDNDGFLDLWHGKYSGGTGTFYLNQGPPDFKLKDITWEANCFIDSPWEGVRTDFDNDGDLDMVVKSTLIRNDLIKKGNWISFRLGGAPIENVSTDAFGTKIYVYAGGKMFSRELMGSGAGTHSNQNSNQLHFGIGFENIIDSVVVQYHNNHQISFKNVQPNAHYYIGYMQNPIIKILATPSLVTPRNFSAKVPAILKLSWDKIAFSKKYQVQIAENNIFGIKAIDETVDAPNTSLNTELVEGRHYYWRVRAMNDSMTSAWSSVWSFICGVPDYSPLKLILPQNNAENVPGKIIFTWNNLNFTNVGFKPYTTYKIQLSENSEFSNISFESEFIRDSSLTVNSVTKASTKYYWRVAPVVDEIQGDWSEVFTFTTMGLPLKIELLQPTDGSQNVSVKGNLNWTTLQSADNYTVQISEFSDFSSLKTEKKNVTKPPLNLIPKLEYNKKYFWRVAGVNQAGPGPWSDSWSFTTEDNVGVESSEKEFDWSIIPNPANEQLKIVIEVGQNYDIDKLQLKLFDLNGNQIYDLTPGIIHNDKIQIELLTSNIKSGTYYLKLNTGNHEETKQVVILH